MTNEELRRVIEEGHPFTLYLADGRSLKIPHRDFILLPPRSSITYVVLPVEDNPEQTVAYRIPLLMITGVSVVDHPQPMP